MTTHNDTDLREALRRRQAHTPQLPDGFTDRLMQRIGEPEQKPRPRRTWLYAVAAAACVLLLIGIGMATLRKDEPTRELLAEAPQKGICKQESVKAPPSAPKAPPSAPEVKAPPSAPEGATIVSSPGSKAVEAPSGTTIASSTDSKTVEAPSGATIASSTDSKTIEAPSGAVGGALPSGAVGGALHYAAYTEAQDTVNYLSPALMDEFISKLASYHHVKAEVLSDSIARSVAYVFPDNDKVRLFDRFLQVASSYRYDSPGYQMTISQQQLLFTLEDTRLSRRYLWLAERIGGGRIILYATHAPIGVTVSSEAYQEFRERTTHTNQTTEL